MSFSRLYKTRLNLSLFTNVQRCRCSVAHYISRRHSLRFLASTAMSGIYNYVYVDVRARGESNRVLMHYAGVPFNDDRDFSAEEFDALKKGDRLPFGQVPVLELSDGRPSIAQSRAILRFLAKEHGLAPTSNHDLARADMISDRIKDMEDVMISTYYEEDETRKGSGFAKFYSETLPSCIENFNKIIQHNSAGQKQCFVGEKISYADIDFFSFFNGFINGGKLDMPEQLNKYPLLADLYSRIMNKHSLLEYLQHRKPNRDDFPY